MNKFEEFLANLEIGFMVSIGVGLLVFGAVSLIIFSVSSLINAFEPIQFGFVWFLPAGISAVTVGYAIMETCFG